MFADPDGVDVSAIVEDVRADGRREYEGVVGLYWLACRRPERLVPRRDDLFAVLGSTSDFSLGESGGARMRLWGQEAVGEFLRRRPEFAPDVFELAEYGDQWTREDAFGALAHATGGERTEPEARRQLAGHVYDYYSLLAAEVREESSVTFEALILLSSIARWHCEEVSELVPDVLERLDHGEAGVAEFSFLAEVALCNEARRPELVEEIVDWLDAHGDPEASEPVAALRALVRIVEEDPETAALVDGRGDYLVEYEHFAVEQEVARLLGRVALSDAASTERGVNKLVRLLDDLDGSDVAPTVATLDALARIVERHPGTGTLVTGRLGGLAEHENDAVRTRARELRDLVES